MFKYPFFKYSFFALLVVNICYTLALISIGAASFTISNWLASAIWFTTFYWLPVWLAAAIIFKIRASGRQFTILEWLISIIAMALGNTVTDNLIHYFFNQPKMGLWVILNGMTWGSIIYFVSRYFESRKKISTEQASRKQAQLSALRYQLNPHFMFNSLNTISAYIHTKPDLADEVLHELADILRYSLDTADKERLPLSQELSIIEKYLNIEKARFGDKLAISINIEESLRNITIPPLLLQPIIENSIKHNTKQESLAITLSIQAIKSGIEIIITDNGKGFSDEVLTQGFGQGIGMQNLQQRIAQLPNGKITLANVPGAQIRMEMAS